MLDVQVKGAAAKIDALFRFDKAAWRDIQRGVKKATEAITRNAESRVPHMGVVPLRGGPGWGPWNYQGRDLGYNRGAFKFSTRFQSRSRAGFRQVQGRSLLDISTPSVSVFVFAGVVPGPNPKTPYKSRSLGFKKAIHDQTSTRPGTTARGMWPRLLTPAYHAEGPIASKTIGKLIEDAVAQINRS
jgi:hypothetical protein